MLRAHMWQFPLRFLEYFNRSMRAIDLGLYKQWKSNDQVPHRCLLNYNKKGIAVETTRAPLKLRQLSGAFLVLVIGYTSALMVFIVERIPCWWNRRQMASTILDKPSECPENRDQAEEMIYPCHQAIVFCLCRKSVLPKFSDM